MDPDPPSFEELKERRRRRRLIWGLPLAIMILAGSYFAVPAAVRAVKGWQSRRLAREAEALIAHEQWHEASLKAGDAYQLRISEPEPWRAIAQLLTQTGQSASALTWWEKLSAVHLLTTDDRRQYAGAALFANALPEAATQVTALLATGGPSNPLDALLASQLASRQGNTPRALEYARQALNDGRSEPHEQISAILQILTLTPRDSTDFAAAWERLLRLAHDPANPMSIDALRLLADPQLPSPEAFHPLLGAAAPPPAVPGALTPEQLAAALDTHPRARPQDHLLAWELRVRSDPAHAAALLAEAGPRFGASDDQTLAALTQFLNAQGHPDLVLQLVSPARAQQTRELSSGYLDALASLGRWEVIKAALATDHLPLDPVARHMYLAVTRAKTNEPDGADVEWQRAQEAAGQDGTKLAAIAAYEEKMGAYSAADTAYAAAIAAAPDQRAAYAARGQLALRRGQTAAARAIWAEMTRRWPEDPEARATRAYLDLLLGAAGADAERAGQAAASLAVRQPADWSARATLALARLREGQAAAALVAFSGERGMMNPQAQPGDDVPPGAQAVWAAALAANGWRVEAGTAAQRVADRTLLPEERALIAPLLAAPPATPH